MIAIFGDPPEQEITEEIGGTAAIADRRLHPHRLPARADRRGAVLPRLLLHRRCARAGDAAVGVVADRRLFSLVHAGGTAVRLSSSALRPRCRAVPAVPSHRTLSAVHRIARAEQRDRVRSDKEMAWPVALVTVVGCVVARVHRAGVRRARRRRGRGVTRARAARRGAALLLPAAAAAQDPGPAPAAPAPAAAEPAIAMEAAKVYVAGHDEVALRGKAYRLRGTMTPAVAGEKVTLRDPPQRQEDPHGARPGRRGRQLLAPDEEHARRPRQRPRLPRPVAGARRRARPEGPRRGRRAARRPGRPRPARPAAAARAGQARLRRAAQRHLRRGDGPRRDGVPQGQRHAAPLRRRPRA